MRAGKNKEKSPVPKDERVVIYPDFHGHPQLPMIGRSHYRRARSKLDDHRHEKTWEFCHLEKGRQTFAIGDRTYTFFGGQMFFTLPGEVHSTHDEPMEKSILYWIQFRLDGVKRFLNFSEAETRFLRKNLLSLKSSGRIFPAGRAIREGFKEIFSAYFSGMPLRKKIFENRLETFFLALMARLQKTRRGGDEKSSDQAVEKSIRWIEAHLTEKSTVPMAADAAGLSISHFKARFRKETGIPPAEYILRRKIEKAKSILSNQGAHTRITHLAHDLGFSSSQNFATAFRRIAGKSPGDWRIT